MNRKKILIVDDSHLTLKLMSLMLAAHDYEVITAEDGGSAVRAVRVGSPDLILLDLSFPPDVGHGGGVAWDGFLIMQWLQRWEEGKRVPIIVMSNSEPDKFRDRALAAGAVNFFQKPIDSEVLLKAIRDTLANNAETLPPPAAPASQAIG
jgi:CheY-like chemotaxis protein